MFGKKKKSPVQDWQSTEVFGRQLSDWASELSDQADALVNRAKVYTKQGKKWAEPRIEQGRKWAEPHLKNANKKFHEFSDEATTRWEGDYRPRLEAAVAAAKTEAGKKTDLKTKIAGVSSAASTALTEPPKKKSKGKKFGWGLVVVATAGISYVIWKRSKPVEDPWAEAYWENIAAEDAAKDAAKVSPDPVTEPAPVVDEGRNAEAEAAAEAGIDVEPNDEK